MSLVRSRVPGLGQLAPPRGEDAPERDRLTRHGRNGKPGNQHPCLCGCNNTPDSKASHYLPGHDAVAAKKVKEFAIEHSIATVDEVLKLALQAMNL